MEMFDTNARIAVLENEIKNIASEIKDHRTDSKEHHVQMMRKIEEIDKRLNVIERWRWMVVGGAVVIGYFISHFFK